HTALLFSVTRVRLSFIYSYVPPPLLHSFPTRPLPISRCPQSKVPAYPASRHVLPLREHPRRDEADASADASRLAPPEPARDASRSEEHTSELQSRRDLVSRLLPE